MNNKASGSDGIDYYIEEDVVANFCRNGLFYTVTAEFEAQGA